MRKLTWAAWAQAAPLNRLQKQPLPSSLQEKKSLFNDSALHISHSNAMHPRHQVSSQCLFSLPLYVLKFVTNNLKQSQLANFIG